MLLEWGEREEPADREREGQQDSDGGDGHGRAIEEAARRRLLHAYGQYEATEAR